jgi:phage baseplate assembly protein gpV
MTLRSRPVVVLALALAVLGLIGSGCSGDEVTSLSTTSTTETPTTAAAEDERTDAGGQDESALEAWQRTAGPYRGRIGERVELECDPGGDEASIWGTNVYTDDSSVCTAAVHQGLIGFDEGGTVTIEVVDGQDEYVGSEANGVTSRSYGAWGGSFSFPDATPLEVASTIDWSRAANFYADRDQEQFTVECEPGGAAGSVWGTGTYTDDSSICTAAVHAGLITFAEGGEVAFRFTAGQDSYAGSSANGVDSRDYGSWGTSFEFVAD